MLTDSGYFFQLQLEKPAEVSGELVASFDGNVIDREQLGTQDGISLLLSYSSGLLSFTGYKDMVISYVSSSGEQFESTYQLLGLGGFKATPEGRDLEIDYCRQGDEVLLKEIYSLEDNEDFFPPSDAPFYLDRFLFFRCPEAESSHLKIRAYLGDEEVNLALVKEEGRFALSGGKTDFIGREPPSSVKIAMSLERFQPISASFSLPFRTRKVRSGENSYHFVFSEGA
jgi:hypothetical protein